MGWNKGGYRGFDEGWNISTAANPQVTPIGVAASSTGSSTAVFTYANVGIGVAAANRRVIANGCLASSGLTIVSVTIGGIAATVAQDGAGNNLSFVASAVVPTGTTADIVVTYSGGNFLSAPMHIWTVNNDLLQSATPTFATHHPTAATAANIALVTANGGFTIFSAISFGAGGAWTIASSDDPMTERGRDNGNGRLWGYSNGTTARTSNLSMTFAASTNLHLTGWNFR